MKKTTLVTGLALILVLPAVAIGQVTPDRGDQRAAVTECQTLRGHTDATREAFSTQFRTFSACVKAHALDEAREEEKAHHNAAWACKEELAGGRAAFDARYGENGNHRNAFGKCVSQKAKAKEHAADEQDHEDATEFKNAAKQCWTEREGGEEAFALKYGTEDTNRENAFGKCVSRTVHANRQAEESEQPS
jgi:hypothetical protein